MATLHYQFPNGKRATVNAEGSAEAIHIALTGAGAVLLPSPSVSTEHFHLISMGRSFQRKMQRQGYATRSTVEGSPANGYGLKVTYWKRTA